MISIVFIASTIRGGGAERVFFNILNSLPSENFKIGLIITSSENFTGIRINNWVEVFRLNNKHSRSAVFNVIRLIRKLNPQYIFTSHAPIASWLPFFKFLFKDKPKIILRVAVPLSAVKRNSIKIRILLFVSRITYRLTDQIIAQTSYMKDDLVRTYNIRPNKISVIPNIIDTNFLELKGSEFNPNIFRETAYNVVASGKLYSKKGFDLLIQALPDVVCNLSRLQLYVLGDEAGEPGYKTYLLDLIKSLGLTSYVHLLGFQQNPFPYYKYADLFVLSSISEGFPNVVLEALYYGTPVLATDCVDFKNVIIDGENGIIVKKGSSKAITEGLILANQTLRRHKIKVENFDYSKFFL